MSAEHTADTEPSKTEVSYQVTVTKIIRNFPYRNKKYEVTGTDKNDENEYGYVYFDDTKDIETAIYKQELTDVDLPAVIKAVNGMEK